MLKFYKNENSKDKKNSKKKFWNILIVDDEIDVHTITKTVLSDFEFNDKKINFTSAYSGKEAYEILKQNNEFAVILLDVIMERDDSGLLLAEQIRNELNNEEARIILRTGHAGEMPIKELIEKYDINDYKEKTQLTTSMLYISVLLALKSYNQIKLISKKNYALKTIIDSNSILNKNKNINEFIHSFFKYLELLINKKKQHIDIKAYYNKNKKSFFTDEILYTLKEDEYLKKIEGKDDIIFKEEIILFKLQTNSDELIVSIQNIVFFDDLDKNLLNIIIDNSRTILENLCLSKELQISQEELIKILSRIITNRSNESISHLKKVSNIAYLLAKEYGLNEEKSFEIKIASSIHDIGQIAIDSNILNKETPLNKKEAILFQKHTNIGYDILKDSSSSLIKAAAIIAHEHHEYWNGAGYPQKLKGNQIHIYSRITLIADVYETLRNPLHNEKPWPMYDVLSFFKKNKNIIFEDKLVDILCKNVKEIEKIILS